MATILLNGALGFVMTVTFVSCITDYNGMVLESTAVFPYIEIFHIATGSKAGATAMTSIVLILTLCTCLSVLAAASRQVFAFARDKGMPFSPWFSKVRQI